MASTWSIIEAFVNVLRMFFHEINFMRQMINCMMSGYQRWYCSQFNLHDRNKRNLKWRIEHFFAEFTCNPRIQIEPIFKKMMVFFFLKYLSSVLMSWHFQLKQWIHISSSQIKSWRFFQLSSVLLYAIDSLRLKKYIKFNRLHETFVWWKWYQYSCE